MGGLHDKVAKAQESARNTPMECPRGWGQIVFLPITDGPFPFNFVKWKCPIGGVLHCSSCRHPADPRDIERLRQQLDELRLMHKQGALSAEEFVSRRAALIDLTSGGYARAQFGFRIVAWLLGPLGTVTTVGGSLLATLLHPGFWGIVGGGAIMLALSISFAVISTPARHKTRMDKVAQL